VAWQLLQSAVVGMCAAGLPVALAPLWQDEQLPSTCAWSTLVAGFQLLVAWQASHTALVNR
jgi:hypothetical protein